MAYCFSLGKSMARPGLAAGGNGDDDLLKRVMNLEGSGVDLETEATGFYSYFFGISDDVRNDFLVSFESEVELGRAWQYIAEWVEEPVDSPSVSSSNYSSSSDDTYDPWNAIYNAKISDVGADGDVAETMSVYELDTTSETHDWYRVDMNVQGSTYSYYDYAVVVGYFIDSIESGISSTDGSSHGELWEHAPETTQTNTSVSYDLGVSLGGEVKKDGASGKGEAKVGYSKSYDCNEVTIVDSSSHAKDMGEWSAQPLGADWWSWPFSYAPSGHSAKLLYL